MPKPPRHLLPEATWDGATLRERVAGHQRTCAKRRHAAGLVLVQCWTEKSEVDYLLTAWHFKTRHQLVRAALRHLLRQTQRGLQRLDGPPEGYD